MIKTKRLLLRPLRKGDERRIFELMNQEVIRFLENVPWPYTKRGCEEFVIKCIDTFGNGKYDFAIEFNEQLIGLVSITDIKKGLAKIGYWLGKEYWGKGFMTEAVSALISAFAGKLRILTGYASTKNTGSQRVLEKCGFLKVGKIPKYYITSLGDVEDAYIYYKLLSSY